MQITRFGLSCMSNRWFAGGSSEIVFESKGEKKENEEIKISNVKISRNDHYSSADLQIKHL